MQAPPEPIIQLTTENIHQIQLLFFQYTAFSPGGAYATIPVLRFNSLYSFTKVLSHWGQVTGTVLDPSTLALTLEPSKLVFWYRYFTVQNLQQIANAHGVVYGAKSRNQLLHSLLSHKCVLSCQSVIYLFQSLSKPRKNVLKQFISEPVASRPQPTSEVNQEIDLPEENETSISHDTAFEILDRETKKLIIQEWQTEMGTNALKMKVCAACGRRNLHSELYWVEAAEINLGLLRNTALPARVMPKSYDLEVYNQALLNPKGLEFTDRLGRMYLCLQCYKSLRSDNGGRTPKFALANWLYYGRESLPAAAAKAFQEASIFDKMMICRARANNIVCRFNAKSVLDEGDNSSKFDAISNARKGVRGNVMVSPLDVVQMNTVIPPGPATVRDTLCAVFVSTVPVTTRNIAKFSPILVKRSRVKTMIEFLLQNNEHYKPGPDFTFSEENYAHLVSSTGEEGVPPSVDIIQIAPNDAIEVGTSDYTPRNEDVNVASEADIVMENVTYTDGDHSPLSYRNMKATALERCLNREPIIVATAGTKPVPDFNNPSIMTWLFPHLDPWGIGGFHHPKRFPKISMEEHVRYLLTVDESPFERDPQFAFVFYNTIKKQAVSSSLRFSVSYKAHEAMLKSMLQVDTDVLARLNEICKHDTSYRPKNPDEVKAFQLLSSMRMIARHVPGSDGYKVLLRNKIRALIHARGTPSLFVTVNPADVDHPIVRLFAGEDINLEDLSRGEDMDSWSRKLLAANHPAACALFFDLMMKKFISVILRYGKKERGVYGHCTAYFGTVEAQGKGTLHCHMLIWLDGHLSPQNLRSKVTESPDFKDRVFRWLESVIKCEFPEDMSVEQATTSHNVRVRHKELGNPHPGTIARPHLGENQSEDESFWKEYGFFVEQLLYEYNWHVHQHTCWKNLRRGQEKNDQTCRLGMNGETREETTLEEETNAILLRRHHPLISAYTDLVTFLMQCNTNTQYIGSGDAAEAYLYYVTDYITKPSQPVHIGMAALAHVARRTQANADAGDKRKAALSAVTSAVNSMMARQEISHPQVLSYLIGGGDYYTSAQFTMLNWGSIKRRAEVETGVRESTVDETNIQAEVIEMSAEVVVDGDQITASNQYLDYALRSKDLAIDRMCLYEFASCTSKRKATKEIKTGRFQEDHPQSESHHLSTRYQRVIPVLLGPSISNPKRSKEAQEKWAFEMLLLFCPWNDPTNLKNDDETWHAAFERFRPSLSERYKKVVGNMTVLTECRDSREKYNARGRRNQLDDQSQDESRPMPFYDLPDQFLAEALSAIEVFERQLVTCREELVEASLMDMLGSENSRLLGLCLPARTVGSSAAEDQGKCVEANAVDRQMIARYGSDMTQRKRKRQTAGPTDQEEPPSNRQRLDTASVEITRLATGKDREGYERYALSVAEKVSRDMNLNKEQKQAFGLIALQLIRPSPEQLLMHVSGVGGTGKSHVIKSVVMLFDRLNRRRELLLGAPTGIAAVLIGGQTLHSLTLQGIGNLDTGSHSELTQIWDHIHFLIVDEISMVGAGFLSKMSVRMRKGKGNNILDSSKPFGGVNVIFMGDFGQLSPPMQASLYSYRLVKELSSLEATARGVEALNGAVLWRQVNKVVELRKNERQAGDPTYASFLGRLRIGKCHKPGQGNGSAQGDYAYISQRRLSQIEANGQGQSLEAFKDAPIIVGSKALRDVLNSRLVVYHAQRQQSSVHDYHSKDTTKGATLSSDVQKLFWSIPSNKNKDNFGRLSLFLGMRVMVTENLAFGWGVVNGCEGTLVEIKYETIDSRRYPLAAFVLIKGCGISIAGLPDDVVPILPSPCSISCEDISHPEVSTASFTRRQLPLVPAYAFTDYKSQGRTMTNVIIDLFSAHDLQGVYVMLSRVKSLSGLAILRSFPRTKVEAPLSQELRTEMTRLTDLQDQTAAELEALGRPANLDELFDFLSRPETIR